MNNANADFWNVTSLHFYRCIYVFCCIFRCRDDGISITLICLFFYTGFAWEAHNVWKKSYENLSFKLYYPVHFVAFQSGLNRTIQIQGWIVISFLWLTQKACSGKEIVLWITHHQMTVAYNGLRISPAIFKTNRFHSIISPSGSDSPPESLNFYFENPAKRPLSFSSTAAGSAACDVLHNSFT